jgi:hypothetical protein
MFEARDCFVVNPFTDGPGEGSEYTDVVLVAHGDPVVNDLATLGVLKHFGNLLFNNSYDEMGSFNDDFDGLNGRIAHQFSHHRVFDDTKRHIEEYNQT